MKPDSRLEKILSDNKSGSTELALKLNNYFKSSSADPDELIELIRFIKERFNGFEVILNYLNMLHKYVSGGKNYSNFLNHFEDEIINSNYGIYKNARNYLLKLNSIVTLSNSKTLSEILKYLYKDNPFVEITIAESRPVFEGRNLAKLLLKENITVELVVDSFITQSIQNADAVIIGADKVLKNGNVINKLGSLSAAISCRYYKKPFYVLASKYKFSRSNNYSPALKKHGEVWNYAHSNLTIPNFYFEEIESRLITKIFTD